MDRHLYGESYLHDMLAVYLGGRAAEMTVLGEGSSGAASDLEKATDLATKMVREFGLSPDIGPIGYPSGGSVFLGDGGSRFNSRPFAEETQAAIDHEVQRLLKQADDRAQNVLRGHRRELDQLVALLVDRESVEGADVYAIAGRPVPTSAPAAQIAPRRAAAGPVPLPRVTGPAPAGT